MPAKLQAKMMWKPRLDPIWARAGMTWSACSARLPSACLALRCRGWPRYPLPILANGATAPEKGASGLSSLLPVRIGSDE